MDSSSQSEVVFDLRALCKSDGTNYFVQDTNQHNYTFNIVGTVNGGCFVPAPISGYYAPSQGAMIQTFGEPADPACPTQCPNEDQPPTTQCCSGPCEVIAQGLPEYSLIDEANPLYGGLQMRYVGVQDWWGDSAACPDDPRSGYPSLRTLYVRIYCDLSRTASRGSVTILGISESLSPVCTYTLELLSAAGCGVGVLPLDLEGYLVPTAATPAENIGWAALGAVAVIVLQLAWSWADKNGHTAGVKGFFSSRLGVGAAPSAIRATGASAEFAAPSYSERSKFGDINPFGSYHS